MLNTQESREYVIVERPVVIRFENPCARQGNVATIEGGGFDVRGLCFRDKDAQLIGQRFAMRTRGFV